MNTNIGNDVVGDNQQGSLRKKHSFKIYSTSVKRKGSFVRRVFERIKIRCRVCNKEFEVQFHDRYNRQTCGNEKCYKAWQSIRQFRGVWKICPICGNRYKCNKKTSIKRMTCGNPICTKKWRGQEIGWVKIAPHLIARGWKPEYRITLETISVKQNKFIRIDFAKPEKKLAIYIDERNHLNKAAKIKDLYDNRKLQELDWKILRITEERILEHINEVLNEISFFDPSETISR